MSNWDLGRWKVSSRLSEKMNAIWNYKPHSVPRWFWSHSFSHTMPRKLSDGPDLNLILNGFDCVARKIHAGVLKTRAELVQAMKRIWKNIPKFIHPKLVKLIVHDNRTMPEQERRNDWLLTHYWMNFFIPRNIDCDFVWRQKFMLYSGIIPGIIPRNVPRNNSWNNS